MAVVKNSLLVRYDGGHIYVSRAITDTSHIEEYLELSNVKTREEAERLGVAYLALLREDKRTDTFSGQVRRPDQALGTGFRLGDKIDGDLIASVTLTVDPANGAITAVPELGDAVTLAEESLQRRIARIAAGTGSEYAVPKIDTQATGSGTDTTPPAFSYSGELEPSFSPIWTVPRPFHLSWLEVDLETAGSTSTRVEVRQILTGGGQVLIGSATLTGGDKRVVSTINRGLPIGTRYVISMPVAGAGAEDLTATMRGVMV